MNITLENIAIISIMTPFLFAFIIMLMKDKYTNIKDVVSIIASSIVLFTIMLLIKPIITNGEVVTIWLNELVSINSISKIGLQIDGISVLIALIISGAFLLSTIYSLKYMEVYEKHNKYHMLFLLLLGSIVIFVFTSDLFTMYMMLEIIVLLINEVSGVRADRFKLKKINLKRLKNNGILLKSLDSLFILIGILLLYIQTKTLNIAEVSLYLNGDIDVVTVISLVCIVIGYVLKSFMIYDYIIQPSKHITIPVPIAIIISGVITKIGIYSIIRIVFLIFGLSSNKAVGYLMLFAGVSAMVIGILIAFMQSDLRKILVFNSVSQIGYIIVGLGLGILESGVVSSIALVGALYYIVNHAIFSILLFLIAGAIQYRTGTTNLNKISGLGKRMPFTMVMFLFGAAAVSGIPPFNGFVAKWMIYEAGITGNSPWISIFVVIISSLTLALFIKVGHAIFFGKIKKEHENIEEVPSTMKIPMGVLSFGIVVFGVFQSLIINSVLYPIVYSTLNFKDYIIASVGEKSNVINNNVKITGEVMSQIGIYDSSNFLLLFISLLVTVLLLIIMKGENTGEELAGEEETTFDLAIFKKYNDMNKYSKKRYEAHFTEKCRYELFVGGEQGENIKLEADDLFFAIRDKFKKYFYFISKKIDFKNIKYYSISLVVIVSILIIYGVVFI